MIAKNEDELQEAIDKFPIVSWLQQRFHIRDSGADRLRIDCPVCRGQKTLSVDCDKKFFHCFRCDEGARGAAVWNGRANLFSFIKIVEGLSNRAVFERIRTLSGVPDVPRTKTVTVRSGFPREAVELSRADPSHPSVQMLIRRGVPHLIPKSKVCVDGEFSGRVLLPCNFLGEVFGFEAKSYLNAVPKSKLNLFQNSTARVHTSWDWDRNIDCCVITESILDAETIGLNSVGIFGSVLREEQLLSLLELRNIGVRRLVWFLDGDAIKKQENSLRRKTRLFFDNLVIPCEVGEDPNSLGRRRCRELISGARPILDGLDIFSRGALDPA